MRKVEAASLESIADYRIVEVAEPQPSAGEVTVLVAACGVGYVDALVSLGRYQVKPPLPHTPGREVAGWVQGVGEGVTGLAAGDRVLATASGGFAEVVRARAAGVSKLPDGMAFGEAAGFPVNYLTALHGLRDRGALKAGETVLVLGAAGGLGCAGMQVAKVLGARVVAAASTPDKRAFCEAQGADAVIDTAPEGWRDRLRAACGGKGPDVVFDPVCGPLFEPAFRSLNWRGRHLVLGFVGGPIPALPANLTLMKGAALVGVDVRQVMEREGGEADAMLRELLGWAAEGRVRQPAGRTFAFEAYADALEYAMSGHGVGKTLLEVTPELPA